MDDSRGTDRRNLLKKISNLSWRISVFSPAMKPFVRFSEGGGGNGHHSSGKFHPCFYWDFDDLLQKQLLALAAEIASPDALVQQCIEQWGTLQKEIYGKSRKALECAVSTSAETALKPSRRAGFVAERMNEGDHLLYLGCGTGGECRVLARKGLRVTGIDTMVSALETAQGWAQFLGLPARFACMDATMLGFKRESFDGFLLELYGSWPLLSQALEVQRALAGMLRPEGKGFVIAARKQYASYWFLMTHPFPSSMVQWLAPQASADFFFSARDGHEERLLYGLYNTCHTVQSLSSELNHCFEVTECRYEEDPRYIIATVRPKKTIGFPEFEKDGSPKSVEYSGLTCSEIDQALRKIEALCDLLEVHAKNVSTHFARNQGTSTGRVFEPVPAEVSVFAGLLRDTLVPHENRDGRGALPSKNGIGAVSYSGEYVR